MSELSELFISISSFEEDNLVNENIVSEDFDKLILLMSQASISLSTVVHFLKTLVIKPQSQSFDHFVQTPKNVSKRRRKKHRGSEESSFEESLQLQPLDETNLENDLNRLSAETATRSPEDEEEYPPPVPTSFIVQTESPCPRQPRTPLLCRRDSDCDTIKQTPNIPLKISSFKDNLFSDPISPIVSFHPQEEEKLGVVDVRPNISNTVSVTHANSTFNSSSVSGENLNERDSVEASVSKPNNQENRVSFGAADYFYFERCQGWSSVCRDGGNTLGMSAKHFHSQTRTLQDSERFPQELNTSELVVEKKGRESLTESEVTTELECLSLNSSCDPVTAERKSSQNNSLQESDYSLDTTDTSKSGKKGELGTRGLERITPRKRRALLKSCSVQLDPREAEELRDLRVRRESVGCDCYGGKCEAANCSCAGEGIQCHQVCRVIPTLIITNVLLSGE